MNKPKEILKKIKDALASGAGRNFLLGNIIIAKGGMSKKQQNEMVDSIIKKIDALLDDNVEVILSKIENVANLSAQDIVEEIINAVAPQFNKIADSQCQNFNELLDKINELKLDEDKIFSKLDDIEKAIKEDGEKTRADIANAKDDVNKHSDENTKKIIQAIVSNGRAMAIHSHSSTRAEDATSNTTSKVTDFKGFIFDVYAGGIRIKEYKGNAKVVVIPSLIEGKRVTSIGDWAFSGCRGLTSITIPDSVTSIGKYAFYKCTGLTSITIPDSVKSIGAWAFNDCKGLTSITIPDSVTSIGFGAFDDCTGLTDVYYQGDLSGWLGIEFDGLYSNPMYYAANLYINGGLLQGELVIPEGTNKIGDHAFYNCDGLTSITIPDSVTSIGDHAFSGCRGLTSITIPDSVTSIGYRAFYGCSGLTSITIPDSVERIGEHAFNSCDKLTIYCEAAKKPLRWSRQWTPDNRPVYWGQNGSTPKDESATSDISAAVGDSKDDVNSEATDSNKNDTTSTSTDGSKKSVTPKATDSSDFDYDIYQGGIRIKKYKGNAKVVVIPSLIEGKRVTSIGDYAFSGCRGLTSITIPDSVTSIGSSAFSDCTGLTRITIPDSVKSIGDWAFYGCTGLMSVTIGDGVTSIGALAFYICSDLIDVYYQGDLSGWLGIQFDSFSSTPMEYADNLLCRQSLHQW